MKQFNCFPFICTFPGFAELCWFVWDVLSCVSCIRLCELCWFVRVVLCCMDCVEWGVPRYIRCWVVWVVLSLVVRIVGLGNPTWDTGTGSIRVKELFSGPQPSVYALQLHIRRGYSRANPSTDKFTDWSDPNSIFYQGCPGWSTPDYSIQVGTVFTLFHMNLGKKEDIVKQYTQGWPRRRWPSSGPPRILLLQLKSWSWASRILCLSTSSSPATAAATAPRTIPVTRVSDMMVGAVNLIL